MFRDPTKIASILGGSNVTALRANQGIDAASKRFRAAAETNLVGELARQGREEERMERENRKRYKERQTSKRNLFGAGAENILAADKELRMNDFLSKVYGVDLGGGGSGIMSLFKN